ncbi:MFS transporter [Actinoplanes sp. LDG1-06]|uniref:MFS transporter n=1 Tax=Paractinoplanes ovalisporus TaxID=2810368 RepID=A0ABS2AN76_9ACTN|nr:MFS transporter [Actinoplanes ovalisporus]MBM2621329.1 MFS transporter [Actinoplanes ovalisporus]
MRVLTDLRPLRENRTFRRLWLGTTASGLGGQFGAFAVTFYIYDRTHSAAALGLVGLVTAVPLIVLALAGSGFTDHVDRRRLALNCTAAEIVVTAAMTVVAFTDAGGVPAMLLLVAVQSSLSALVGPARQTFVPALLTGDRLAAGLALNGLSFQVAMLLGPALAGGLTAVAGVGWCLAFDTLTFVAALAGLAGLPSGGPADSGAPGWRAVAAGLSYAVRTPTVRGALLADLAATVLAMPVGLFLVLNTERFGGRAEIVGLFTTAVAVGGVAASILSGFATRQTRPGRLLLICGAIWAVALGLAGVTGSLLLVLALLALAGGADTWAVVSRGTVIQTVTPPGYRGRISSLEHIVGVAGPQIGILRSGLVAAATSGGAALTLGGVTALLATGLIALSTPQLRAFKSR